MADNREFYNAIKTALIVGILLTLVLNLYMRERIKRENTFSEIYFNEHKDLPHKLKVNESKGISFTLTNHELEPTTYTYEIDSKTGKHRENITLVPGQQALVHYTIKPENKIWSLNLTVNKTYNNTIDVLKDSTLARDNEFNIIIDNATLRHYLPISHNIPDFGYIYHTNLTTKELEKKPFKKTYNETFEENNQTIQKQGELTLYVNNEGIYLDLNETENNLLALEEPFTVKLYKYNSAVDDQLEIHFWYSS
jgi:hypothetical protein